VERDVTTDSSDYMKYRGKCKILSEEYVKEHPTATLVRGYYHCPIWGPQQHWWVEDNGIIIDLTRNQFPSKGLGFYESFNGITTCEVCGKQQTEAETVFGGNGNHVYCSNTCYMYDVL
jgi:hypothetical protein